MSINSTSKVLSYTDADTGLHGVILPQSSRVFFESEIDIKIQKANNRIKYLSSAQAYRRTHGGKRFRAKQISLRNQMNSTSDELSMLSTAKAIIVKLNKDIKLSAEQSPYTTFLEACELLK